MTDNVNTYIERLLVRAECGLSTAFDAADLRAYMERQAAQIEALTQRAEHELAAERSRLELERMNVLGVETAWRACECELASGTAELRRYVEHNGFTWCETENTVFNVTTTIGHLAGTIDALRAEIAALMADDEWQAEKRERLTRRSEAAEHDLKELRVLLAEARRDLAAERAKKCPTCQQYALCRQLEAQGALLPCENLPVPEEWDAQSAKHARTRDCTHVAADGSLVWDYEVFEAKLASKQKVSA